MPLVVGSPSDTWIPVSSLSWSFLPKPPLPASIVAEASWPYASQRMGWFAGFE
jgi:hypothetical protein